MPLEERANFYRDNAALYKDALAAKMREVLTQIIHKRDKVEDLKKELADQKKALADKTAEVVKTKKELEKTKTQLVKNEPLRMLGERMWQKLQI